MKKFLICLAAAALALTACSKADKAAVSDGDVTEAERVAAEQEATSEEVLTGQQDGNFFTLSDDNLYRPDKAVKKLTILDFNAVWCGPCRNFAPVFHQAAEMFPNVNFVSVDVDANPATAEAFGVSGIPHVSVISPNGDIQTYIGTGDLMPIEKFVDIINKALAQ